MQFTKRYLKHIAGSTFALALVAGQANAAAPDYSVLLDDVDWSTGITAVLAIAGLLAAVLAVRKGARMVLSMIK